MKIVNTFFHNPLVILLGVAIILDTILGVLRAFKYHKFNSSAGIDGAIRKAAMVASIAFLSIADMLLRFDMLFFIPKEWLGYINLQRVGLCEFFCLMFVLFEAISILKNMLLCGLPIPKKIKAKLEEFLNIMTQEKKDEQEDQIKNLAKTDC